MDHEASNSQDRIAGCFAILRVVDANLNRCGEALRVIEDSLRFVFCDSSLASACKTLRHELGGLASEIRKRERPESFRDAAGDVGATTSQTSEYVRNDISQIVGANFSRTRESLRTLEEFCKTLNPDWAKQLETLRYRAYDLERAVITLMDSRQRLELVTVCVLVDACGDKTSFRATSQALIDGGAQMIQLRDKTADCRTLLDRAEVLVELTRKSSVVSIINDRADIAVAAGADGVHLGQDDLSVMAARKIGGVNLLIGVSTHSVEQAHQAVWDGANYIGVGPTFESTTKSFLDFPGIELVRQVAASVSIPAMAIGGITIENVDQVIHAGLGRVAVSGAVLRNDQPIAAATRRLVDALSGSAANVGAVNAGN